MTPKPPGAETILSEAVEILDPVERAAFLDRACGEDLGLRKRLGRLADAHFRAGNFLEPPPGVAFQEETVLFEPDRTEFSVENRIGPYILRDLLGEGGMGSVYVADQTEPVKRQVALKVIKPGMDSRQVVARFEAERQALALMDHPNIARILDGGTTDAGLPFFVMELVRGVPITDYCDQASLSTRQRLELFVQVCTAVQHAHQKGIIHRDLKPSNVLVTLYDGVPVPKVIDFGIAKVIGTSRADYSAHTGLAQMIGTPLYMSPEQAELSSLDLDTRTDVYSLGVLLYELLTGVTPFDPERFRSAGFDEIRRIIREDTPARPSARLSTLEAKARLTLNGVRRTDGRKQGGHLRGELDWIVMRCLEKDRNRRYEGVSALAADVLRYLADEPIAARPPSRWYQIRKFARRNRRVLLLALVAVFGVLPVVAGSLGWALADRAERRRNAERRIDAGLAEVETLHTEGRWSAAREAVRGLDPLLAIGGVRADRAELVRTWRTDLEMVSQLAELRLWLATNRDEKAEMETLDREFTRAFRDYGIDVETLDPERTAELFRSSSVRVELAAAIDDWIEVRQTIDRLSGQQDVRGWCARLKAIARDADPDPTRYQVRDAVLQDNLAVLQLLASSPDATRLPTATLTTLGIALGRLGDSDGAVALLWRAQARHPGDFWVNSTLARYMGELRPPRPNESLRFYTAAAALAPSSPGAQVSVGLTLQGQKRLIEAEECYREAIRLNPDLVRAHGNLANTLGELGKYEEAVQSYREVIRLDPNVGWVHRNLGDVLTKLERREEAIPFYREAVRLRPNDSIAYYNLGVLLAKQGKKEEAIPCFRESVQQHPDYVKGWYALSKTLGEIGRHEEAIPCCWQAILLDPNDPKFHDRLGIELAALGRWEEAISNYREAIKISTEFGPTFASVADAQAELGRLEEAVKNYQEAIEREDDNPRTHANLSALLLRLGRFEEALAEVRLAHELGQAKPNWNIKASAQNVQILERMVATNKRLPNIVSGAEKPANNEALLLLADAAMYRKWYAASVTFFADALRTDPKLHDQLHGPRYNAACAAILAGSGRGADPTKPTEDQRIQYRKQALGWLSTELTGWSSTAKNPASHRTVRNTLDQWRTDPDLAPIRDEAELTKLPAAEQADWNKLWGSVANLRASVDIVGPPKPAILLTAAVVVERLRQAEAADKAGRWNQAAEAIVEPFAVLKRVLGRGHPRVVEMMRRVNDSLRRAGRWAESEAIANEHLEVTILKYGRDHLETQIASGRIAGEHLAAGRDREAITHYESLLEKMRVNPGPQDPRTIGIMTGLGQAYYMSGRFNDAVRIQREALALRRKIPRINRQDFRWELLNLGSSLLALEQYADAEPLLREGLQLLEAAKAPPWGRFRIQSELGATLAGLGKADQAERLLLASFQGLKSPEGFPTAPWRYVVREAGVRLVRFYESTNRPDKAKEWRAKLPREVAPLPRPK